MDEYDISTAFEEIEAELIRSMARNFRGHREWELSKGFDWPMWQAEQLKALERYRKEARKAMGGRSADIDRMIDRLLTGTFQDAAADQERKIMQAIRRGAKLARDSHAGEDPDAFFRTNSRKLDALREAVKNDLKTAETATMRMTDDIYRKTIFNAQVYANTGAGTLWQAVDMATKSFLSAGLGAVQYRDGRRVNAASYAEMAIRTANKRAYLAGEGAKRQEWGVSLVLVTRRGTGCPYCVQWQGRVYIDDVWSGGRPDGKHPLLSTAIAGGLYHPNCKDSHTTFFPGVNTEPLPVTAAQQAQMVENYNLQQKQRYYERQVKKYKRLEAGSLDPASVEKYRVQREAWQTKTGQLVASHPDVLRREYARERVRGKTSDRADTNSLTLRHGSGKVGDTDGYTVLEKAERFDAADETRVPAALKAFGDQYASAKVEHALVLSTAGDAYLLTGIEGAVNTGLVGADALPGAVVIHNHPVAPGMDRADSFSREDLLFAVENKAGMQYLASGTRRNAFLYTGDASVEAAYQAYQKARSDVLERAFSGELEIEFEQEEIMKVLPKYLKGFEYHDHF